MFKCQKRRLQNCARAHQKRYHAITHQSSLVWLDFFFAWHWFFDCSKLLFPSTGTMICFLVEVRLCACSFVPLFLCSFVPLFVCAVCWVLCAVCCTVVSLCRGVVVWLSWCFVVVVFVVVLCRSVSFCVCCLVNFLDLLLTNHRESICQ